MRYCSLGGYLSYERMSGTLLRCPDCGTLLVSGNDSNNNQDFFYCKCFGYSWHSWTRDQFSQWHKWSMKKSKGVWIKRKKFPCPREPNPSRRDQRL